MTRTPKNPTPPTRSETPMSHTKITLIVDNPSDVAAFEDAFPALLESAAALPDLIRLESGRVFPKEDGTPTPAHRTLDLYFTDYETASRAVQSPEAGALFGGLATTEVGFTGLFTDVELA